MPSPSRTELTVITLNATVHVGSESSSAYVNRLRLAKGDYGEAKAN
jgi:hypothetical protein